MRSMSTRAVVSSLAVALTAAASTEWNVSREAGKQAFEQGRYAEAVALDRDALEAAEQKFTAESVEVAACLNDLAGVDTALGKFDEAESLYRRALNIWSKIPNSEASEAQVLSNLGVLLRSRGRYPEAETIARQSLEIHARVFGAEHPDTATTLGNLGELYSVEGRYAEAEAAFRRALAIREK